MDNYNDKVIPTLDDVISVGDPELAQLGNINALEDDFDDDFNDAAIRLDISESDSINDDSFENEFDNIALAPDNAQAETEPDEIAVDLFTDEIESDSEPSAGSDDFDQSITDMIVAERFAEEESILPEQASATAAEEIPTEDQDQSASNDTAAEMIDRRTTAATEPVATLSADTTPTINTETLIGKIVDEITRELLPEIEWKIRTRVRDILEQRLSDKD